MTHPDRVYWEDAGVTKQMLAEYYTRGLGLDAAACRRPGAGAGALPRRRRRAMLFPEARLRRHRREAFEAVPDDGDKSITVDSIDGLVSLAQAGVLEIHVRGSSTADLEAADRLVFDLDPGPGVEWKDVIAAARDVRQRLRDLKLESFVKTTGGKGLHVVLPIKPVALG